MSNIFSGFFRNFLNSFFAPEIVASLFRVDLYISIYFLTIQEVFITFLQNFLLILFFRHAYKFLCRFYRYRRFHNVLLLRKSALKTLFFTRQLIFFLIIFPKNSTFKFRLSPTRKKRRIPAALFIIILLSIYLAKINPTTTYRNTALLRYR